MAIILEENDADFDGVNQQLLAIPSDAKKVRVTDTKSMLQPSNTTLLRTRTIDRNITTYDVDEKSSSYLLSKQSPHGSGISGTIDGDAEDVKGAAFQLDKNNNVFWTNMRDVCCSEQDSIDLDQHSNLPKPRMKMKADTEDDGNSRFDIFTRRGSNKSQLHAFLNSEKSEIKGGNDFENGHYTPPPHKLSQTCKHNRNNSARSQNNSVRSPINTRLNSNKPLSGAL